MLSLPLNDLFALFLDWYREKARKTELCVSNGSQRPEQTEIQLNGKSNKNSAKTNICALKKIILSRVPVRHGF